LRRKNIARPNGIDDDDDLVSHVAPNAERETPMNQAFISNRLFREFPTGVLTSIPISEKDYGPGTVIFGEGEPGATLMLVGRGRVQISKTGRQGQQESLATIERDDFFGEFAMIDHGPRSACATALEPSLVGEIDQKSFNQLMQSAPDTLLKNFLGVVVERLRDTNSRFIEQLLQSERLSLLGTMVSSIIHDFKNPMSAILSSADYLGNHASSDTTRRLAEIIRASATRMVDMTEELLDFARGTINLRPTPTSTRRLLELLDQEILQRIRDSGARVEVGSDDVGPLLLDERRIVRCLMNIVKNANEAVGSEGTIRIEMRDADPNLAISIEDDGPGVPEAIRRRMFEPFITYGKKGGTGLGMAISKATMDAHGGKIWLESESKRGATFRLLVPKKLVSANP
jgi:signal transduction histidine kinase